MSWKTKIDFVTIALFSFALCWKNEWNTSKCFSFVDFNFTFKLEFKDEAIRKIWGFFWVPIFFSVISLILCDDLVLLLVKSNWALEKSNLGNHPSKMRSRFVLIFRKVHQDLSFSVTYFTLFAETWDLSVLSLANLGNQSSPHADVNIGKQAFFAFIFMPSWWIFHSLKCHYVVRSSISMMKMLT